MIIDTYSVIAILAGKPMPRIVTPAPLIATIVLTRWFGKAAETALDAFMREARAEIVLFNLPQLGPA